MTHFIYACKKCKESWAISMADPSLHVLKRVMRCPNADACEGRVTQSKGDSEGSSLIGGLKFYQASMGVGLPGERVCSASKMKKLLKGATIVDCHLEDSPDKNRSIIFSLKLSDGKTVHLANSSRGATIYKVTEEKHGR